jgi:hypothetical protein
MAAMDSFTPGPINSTKLPDMIRISKSMYGGQQRFRDAEAEGLGGLVPAHVHPLEQRSATGGRGGEEARRGGCALKTRWDRARGAWHAFPARARSAALSSLHVHLGLGSVVRNGVIDGYRLRCAPRRSQRSGAARNMAASVSAAARAPHTVPNQVAVPPVRFLG